LYYTNFSASSSPVSVTDQKIDVSWTNPADNELFPGFTYAGTIVGITADGGAAGTEKMALYVTPGSATTGTITSALAAAATVAFGAAAYRHLFGPGTSDLSSLTIEKVPNQGTSEIYLGSKVSEFSMSMKPGEILSANLTIMAQRMIA